MQKSILKKILLPVLFVSLFSCSSDEHEVGVITGKEYNSQRKSVVDTTSSFFLNDQFKLRFDYGKPFQVEKIVLEVLYETGSKKGKLFFKKELPVDRRSGHLVIQGSREKGLKARTFFRRREGSYRMRFLMNNKLVAEKVVELKSHK